MASVSNVNAAGDAFTGMNKAAKASSDAQSTQDRFLKLLITQLKNQDPMNPTDSAQTTSQMAQISTVSGIENLNASMSSMMSTFNAAQSFQAAGLIGHEVMAKGAAMAFDGSKAVAGKVVVPEGGGFATVSIYDKNNLLVRTIDVGSKPAGPQDFSWDGKDKDGKDLPAGKYLASATIKGADGKTVSADTMTNVQVSSVSLGTGGVKLHLANGGDLAMSDVIQIQ
ncbi:flagellar hook assembly protein FlgD [Chitinimonas sp.]|uniref:flagellar hook assembly protein FlgD n=1 Tax=Chitinimonas sp. TaxID=1934313 RepID=UPI0035B05A83